MSPARRGLSGTARAGWCSCPSRCAVGPWGVAARARAAPCLPHARLPPLQQAHPLLPQYVRVSQDTPSSVIYHLMTQHWGLDVPNLLISVTGGAKNFNMKLRLKSIFRRGLVKVAQTTGGHRGLSAAAGVGRR